MKKFEKIVASTVSFVKFLALMNLATSIIVLNFAILPQFLDRVTEQLETAHGVERLFLQLSPIMVVLAAFTAFFWVTLKAFEQVKK